MQIISVNNIKLDLLMKKFNKQVVRLKSFGMSKDEISSELYTTILMCSKNFNNKLNVSFYNYLHSSIQKNLYRLINQLSEINNNEKSIDQDFGYTPKDQGDIDFICYVKSLPSDIVESISEYMRGEISEIDLNDCCSLYKIDSDRVFDIIDSYL